VDLIGIEPMTSSMPWKRAPSCATGPQREEHPLFWRSMTIPSNATHMATGPVKRRPRLCPKLAQLTLLVLGACFAAVAQTPTPPAAAASPAPVPPPPAGFDLSTLRPALGKVQSVIGELSIARWKVPSATRSAAEADVASMQRDLTGTLPGLMSQVQSAGPGVLSPSFAVFRNVDALYDVLLRVTGIASLANAPADASSLDDARSALEDARGKLGSWLLQSIGSQDAEMARLKAPPPAPAAAPAPSKTVVEDGPATPKTRKKKPAPTPAPQ
jgi:hypothetical protein